MAMKVELGLIAVMVILAFGLTCVFVRTFCLKAVVIIKGVYEQQRSSPPTTSLSRDVNSVSRIWEDLHFQGRVQGDD